MIFYQIITSLLRDKRLRWFSTCWGTCRAQSADWQRVISPALSCERTDTPRTGSEMSSQIIWNGKTEQYPAEAHCVSLLMCTWCGGAAGESRLHVVHLVLQFVHSLKGFLFEAELPLQLPPHLHPHNQVRTISLFIFMFLAWDSAIQQSLQDFTGCSWDCCGLKCLSSLFF